nr:hypothetical protein [Tanacetum cinerariifolium]
MELTVFLLLSDEKVRIGVSVVDLQVFAVRLMLLLLALKFLLFGLTNWCCSLSAISEPKHLCVLRLQALVDKKKVVVTEATIQEALRLDDAEAVKCLPNEEIFTELARIGYEKPSTKLTFYKAFFSSQWKFLIHTILQCMSAKRTSWNEFSLSMASAVICLSSGKGFSGVETPLFEGMLVAHEVEEGDADENVENVNVGDTTEGDDSAAHDAVPTVAEEPSIPSPTPPTPQPQPSHDILSTSQRVETSDETMMDDVSNQGRMIADMDQDADVVLEDDEEVADDVKYVQDDIDESAQDQGRKAKSQAEIYKIDLKHANKVLSMQKDESEPAKVQELNFLLLHFAAAPARVTVAPSRRRKGVVIRVPQEESTTSTIIPAETKSKDKGKRILVKEPKLLKKKQQIEQDEKYARELEAELNKNIDWDEVIDHVKKKANEEPVVKKYQAIKRKPQTEVQARKNMMLYLKNVVGFKIDYFKGMSYDNIRPIFEVKFNTNVSFLLKTKEKIKEEESRALKRLNETLAEKAAKRQKLDEKVEELKRHLQIVPNEDDDVYTEATPLARKVPVVDYEIIKQNNKPYYKIIRADGTHQLYKNQRSVHGPAKVNGWKLLESCGVQIITFTTTQLVLLVERKYPFTRSTLDQMLNAVRLEVDEESEVSLELLSFGVDAAKEFKKNMLSV